MSDAEDDPVLTEPLIVRSVFLTGTAVEGKETYVRIIGFEQLPEVGTDLMKERRIVLRAVLPSAVARVLMLQLRRILERGH